MRPAIQPSAADRSLGPDLPIDAAAVMTGFKTGKLGPKADGTSGSIVKLIVAADAMSSTIVKLTATAAQVRILNGKLSASGSNIDIPSR